MAPQPSFDPLAQPDILAALTRPDQASLGSWTSFDEGDAFAGPSQPSHIRARTVSDAASNAYFGSGRRQTVF